MSKVSINTFEGGMNLDTSKVVQGKNKSYTNINFRPWTDTEGKAVGGLLNIKGNELSISIPTTTPIYLYTVTYGFTPPATDTFQLTLNGVTTNVVVDIIGADNTEITTNIINQLEVDPTFIAGNFTLNQVDDNSFYVTSLNQGGAALWNIGDGSSFLNRFIHIDEQNDLQVIGWTTIRDDFYLFTTNDDTDDGGLGQIWRLEVDSVTNATSLSIIYNNFLNFSTEYPIEAIGRYETECIKRLYWTDNFNKVRTISTLNDRVFWTDLENLDIIPVLNHSQPVLQEILTGGGLKVGMWQTAYRLKSSSGGETSFSLPSRLVPIVSKSETDTNYWEYIGEDETDVPTGKALSYIVENLDTDYDTIEVVSIYTKSKTSLPIITSVLTEPIPETGTFEYIITGTEAQAFTIAIEEFLLVSRSFTHGKTLTSKDNRLFVANTRYELPDIDAMDTRAYGFALNSDTFSIDNTLYDLSGLDTFDDVPTNANAINDDTDVYKFKQGTSIYGGTGKFISYEVKTKSIKADNRALGGGNSLSEYDSLPIRDVVTPYPSPIDLNEGKTYNQPALWQGLKNPYTFDLYRGYQRDEIYRFGIVFYDKQGNAGFANWVADIKIPECYNAGRSAYGTDGYVNGNFDGNLIEGTDFGITNIDYSLNIPYVEFEVNLPPEVLEVVSGYSVVRMERTDADKTVVGQGLAFKTAQYIEIDYDAVGGPALATPIGPLVNEGKYLFAGGWRSTLNEYANVSNPAAELNLDDSLANLGANKIDYFSEYLTLQAPDHLFTNSINFAAGDYIKTVDVLGLNSASSGLIEGNWTYETLGDTDQDSIQIFKTYSHYALPGVNLYTQNIESTVDRLWKVNRNAEIAIDSGRKFRNEKYSPYRASGSVSKSQHGEGTNTLLLKLDTPIYSNSSPNSYSSSPSAMPATDDGGLNGATRANSRRFYILNYKRDLLKQYGGNTYTVKGNNAYISTGNYVQVDKDYTPLTFEVFGGDTFLTIYDSQKYQKSWATGSGDQGGPLYEATFLFPVESSVMTEMTHGARFQVGGNLDDGTNSGTDRNNETIVGLSVSNGESFAYNTMFSVENNLVKFFAKPAEFDATCSDEFDTRIFASDVKINGELTDSWRTFRANEFIDLESLYGPINRVFVLNDAFYSFQDRATCNVSINPRVQTSTTDGGTLELGTGGVLHDYNYYSTNIGCKHQWAVIPSRSHLYFVDINSSKMYKVSPEGIAPLSDTTGLFSYLDKNLVGNLRLNELERGDNPIKNKGITGYYDYKYNEVVFSFLGEPATFTELIEANSPASFVEGDIVSFNGNYAVVTGEFEFVYNIKQGNPLLAYSPFLKQIHSPPKGFTVVFNEFVQAYSSFYTFESPIYFYDPSNVFSIDSESVDDLYVHNTGNRGEFYGVVNDSSIHFYANEAPINTKTFDNLIWHTESKDVLDITQNFDTFYRLRCNTTYQDSDYINLINNNSVKRRERTWQMAVPRSTTNLERMRDKHMEIKLDYDNSFNNRFLVHLVGNSFRVSAR